MREYFDNIIGIGKLFIDFIFVQYESEPILFTCIDENSEHYLCICTEIRFRKRWIVARSNPGWITKLIKHEVDIATAMTRFDRVIVIEEDLHGNETSRELRINDLTAYDLPRSGTMLHIYDPDGIQKYLDLLNE